jgi:hypothetical protein
MANDVTCSNAPLKTVEMPKSRIRSEALQFILDNVKLFTTSASRFDVFSKLIGCKLATVKSQAFYDLFEVPLLYDKWDRTIDVNTVSRGNVVVEVRKTPHFFSIAHFLSFFLDLFSFIRGRQGAMGLFEGNSKLLQAKCHERIHKIPRTTLGAIVTASILVCSCFIISCSS